MRTSRAKVQAIRPQVTHCEGREPVRFSVAGGTCVDAVCVPM